MNGNLFQSGTSLIYTVLGLLAAASLIVGTLSTLKVMKHEGAGSAMTNQLLSIALSVTIFLSCGIAAIITHEAQSHGIKNPVSVPNPWGQ